MQVALSIAGCGLHDRDKVAVLRSECISRYHTALQVAEQAHVLRSVGFKLHAM